MNSFFILTVAFSLFLLRQQANADSPGSCAAEAQNRRDSCGQLVKPHHVSGGGGSGSSSENNGEDGSSNEGSGSSEVTGVTSAVSGATDGVQPVKCDLTDYFYNISLTLSGESYELFIEWIREIQVTILVDVSLSADQQIVQIAYSLKAFFSEHVEIQESLYFVQLGSWGYVVDFIYVAYQIQIEVSQEIVTLGAGGDCALFHALRNATADNSEQASAVEELIAQITIILQTSSWTYSQQQAQIYLLFQQFFIQYSEWEAFFFGIQIEGYGFFQYYFDVTFKYQSIVTISEVIGGDVSSCLLLQALIEASQNTSFSITVRSEFQQLEQKLEAFFESTVDIDERLNYVVSQCFSLFELISYMEVYVEGTACGSWGFIYDIIFCSDICVNNGCGSPGSGPGTLPPSSESTEAAATTEAATTVPAEGASSAAPAAECSTRWSVLEIQVSSNTTYFTDCVGDAYATWSASTKASFGTYWNQIRSAIWSTTFTQSEILSKVVTACSSFNANNAAKQQILFNVTITEWFGTVGEFVTCGTSM